MSTMTDEITRNILKRLKTIEGHLSGVCRMVEEGEYCIDIMNQVLALERALEKVNTMILDRHLHTCASRAIRGKKPAERDKAIREILDLFSRRLRR